MTTILSRAGTDDVIPKLTLAIEQTNAARRVGRGAMIRLAMAEGMTTTRCAKRLGIPRRLVERHRGEHGQLAGTTASTDVLQGNAISWDGDGWRS